MAELPPVGTPDAQCVSRTARSLPSDSEISSSPDNGSHISFASERLPRSRIVAHQILVRDFYKRKMNPARVPHAHPLSRIDSPPSDYSDYSATIMPTCDVCGDENIGVAYHCQACSYDECVACHSAATKPDLPQSHGGVQPVSVLPNAGSPDKNSALATQFSCLPLIMITISTLAFLTLLDVVGLMRVTESIYKHEPHIVQQGSIRAVPGSINDQSGSGASSSSYYEATPDRVWQTTGVLPGNSRRAILYLVSNSTTERKRGPEDFPPGSQVRCTSVGCFNANHNTRYNPRCFYGRFSDRA